LVRVGDQRAVVFSVRDGVAIDIIITYIADTIFVEVKLILI
jgi:hypothetical protein